MWVGAENPNYFAFICAGQFNVSRNGGFNYFRCVYVDVVVAVVGE